MAEVGWFFPILTGGGEEGYTSNDIEAFKGEELYENLARETCQNSLDAMDPESNEPVRVDYGIREFQISAYAFFEQYAAQVKRCREYWTERPDGIPERLNQLLSGAEETLSASTVTALVVSDFNTPGLRGSRDMTGSFNALVYAEGVSYKQSDTSAGSFGIGRNAPFACSSLSCVCYNTKATDGYSAFAGIAKLATAWDETGTKKTRKNGRYQYNNSESDEWRPIRPEDGDKFAGEFSRKEYGTDVIILGFDVGDWQVQLKKAVLKNFFLAIHQRKLVVRIEDELIDSETLPNLLEQHSDDKGIAVALEYYKAVIESEAIGLNILDDNDATLYIRTETDSEKMKGVAFFRGNGMLICQYKPAGIFRPYAAVFVADGDLDKLLRKTEPARHNKWDYKLLGRGTEEFTRARKALEYIRKSIKASLSEACEAVVDMSIDAAGAADYLPDSEGGGAENGGGTDLLRPLIKIAKIKVNKTPKKNETTRGKRGTGNPSVGRAGNSTRHPNPNPQTDPPKPVSGSGETQGVRKGTGGKTIVRPVRGDRRIFGLAPSAGVYSFIILPDDGAEEAYASCSIVGENGSKETANVKKAMMSGQEISVDSDGTIGPFMLEKGERTNLVITFEDQSSMALDVDLWAGGKK